MQTSPQPAVPAQTLFVSRMFDETVQLLIESHEYLSTAGGEVHYVTPVERLVYSAEVSRLTLRISSVMAWLLARKAEAAGQISRSDAVTQFRLGFREICLKELPAMHQVLPPPMCELLERSRDMYRRAMRLDRMILPESETDCATVH
ncbi:MAG: DUF1465 family protein [Alphaproteobacteria bacterium]|nr:DUF1465 family protein [Alphaproteobacteria bacterium]